MDLFSGLNLKQYQIDTLTQTHARFSFTGKRVVEIGSDGTLQTALGMLRLGASEVHALNPQFSKNLVSPDPRIIPYKTPGERSGLPDRCADIVFGVALLEHVLNPNALATEIRRIIAPGGKAFLQGNPMWPSWRGHHTWISKSPSGKQYYFNQESNPFEPWEHLTLQDESAVIEALRQKGITEEDSRAIAAYCLYNPILSHHSSATTLEPFLSLPKINVHIWRAYTKQQPNNFFVRALKFYSEEELRTEGIHIWLEA